TAGKARAHIGEDNLQLLDNGSRATSFIVDPAGRLLTDVLDQEEGLAIAEIDLKDCVSHKRMHDVVGYYNRFDVFNLTVNRTANRPARFIDDPLAVSSREPEIPKIVESSASGGSQACPEAEGQPTL